MNKQQITMALVLDKLDIPIKMNTFKNRLVIQKVVYLAQEAGIHLGYFFRWYLRGPYCSHLANDAFLTEAAISGDDADYRQWNLSEKSKEKIEKLKGFLAFEEINLNKYAKRYELLASVHFIVSREQVKKEDAREIKELLEKYNKNYEESEVSEALGELRINGILN